MDVGADADHRLAEHPTCKHHLHHQTVLLTIWKRLADLRSSFRRLPRW